MSSNPSIRHQTGYSIVDSELIRPTGSAVVGIGDDLKVHSPIADLSEGDIIVIGDLEVAGDVPMAVIVGSQKINRLDGESIDKLLSDGDIEKMSPQ